MRKVWILSILFTLVLIGCSGSVQSLKSHPDPDGFKNIRWGTDISTITDMEKVKLDNPSNKNVVWYARKGEILTLGKAEIESIFYSFWMGSFEGVWIDFEGGENLEALKKELFKAYGKVPDSGELKDKRGMQIEQADEFYSWKGENTEVFLFYSKIRHKGNLTLNSRKIGEERRAYEKEKKKEERLKDKGS